MMLDRRLFGLALASLLASGPALAQTPAPARPVVVLFGDSISAGYGLPPEQGLAAALQVEMEAIGVEVTVRNVGVPGVPPQAVAGGCTPQ